MPESEAPPAANSDVTVKPGAKTSEFYLHVLAIVLSACFASGLIPTDGTAEKIAVMIAIVLTSLGYTVSRTTLKQAEGTSRA